MTKHENWPIAGTKTSTQTMVSSFYHSSTNCMTLADFDVFEIDNNMLSWDKVKRETDTNHPRIQIKNDDGSIEY